VRFVALVLTVVVLGAGAGLVSVGTAQAHSGAGGGGLDWQPQSNICQVPTMSPCSENNRDRVSNRGNLT
jgi:hypothetical protein